MNDRELDIIGEEPSLEGSACEEIIAQEFWHEGELEEPLNVVHLKFDGCWFRLCFDSGIVFWRDGSEPKDDFEAPEIHAIFRLSDIGRRHGLVGLTLTSIASRTTEDGAEVVLTFDGGRTIVFFDENDRADYAC